MSMYDNLLHGDSVAESFAQPISVDFTAREMTLALGV